MVIIDGLGDHIYIKWLNSIPAVARDKIERRWHRFRRKMDKFAVSMLENPDRYPDMKHRLLEQAYRR